MAVIISRFAPAPTGFLHLGHVVSAVHVWGVTRARGGKVLVRVEDHDRQRARPEFAADILGDLDWLGFTPDGPVVRQSNRDDIYRQALDRLRRQGLVYACACSRADIAGLTSRTTTGTSDGAAAFRPDEELRYPGTCADRALPDAPGLGLRVRLAPSIERFIDLRHGPLEQRPSEQCGDLLVRDREGNWTYQFAATVDDVEQGITLVIRGDDLLTSTGRQIQLARLLGRPDPPEFLHHPLVMKSPRQKLSKSDRDTGVGALRAEGWSAARVIGQAVFLAGLIPEPCDVRAADVSSMMSLFTKGPP
jgi:glutamyl-Q tRNA(Asp) synthetase